MSIAAAEPSGPDLASPPPLLWPDERAALIVMARRHYSNARVIEQFAERLGVELTAGQVGEARRAALAMDRAAREARSRAEGIGISDAPEVSRGWRPASLPDVEAIWGEGGLADQERARREGVERVRELSEGGRRPWRVPGVGR
jgi:hypothetical protein